MKLSERTLAQHNEVDRDFVELPEWTYSRASLAQSALVLEAVAEAADKWFYDKSPITVDMAHELNAALAAAREAGLL